MADRKNNYINTDLDRIINIINAEIKKYPENYLGISGLKFLVTSLTDLKAKESLFDPETGKIKPEDYQTYHKCCDKVRNAFNDVINLGANESKEKNYYIDPELKKFLKQTGAEYSNFLPLISEYFPDQMKKDVWQLNDEMQRQRDALIAQWKKEIDDGNPPKYPSGTVAEFPAGLPEKIKLVGNMDDLASYCVKYGDKLSPADHEFLKNRAQVNYYLRNISKDSKKYKYPTLLTPVVSKKNPDDVQLSGFEGLYEQQTTFNGCWSCTYSMLLKSRGVPVTQQMIRSFRPDIDYSEAMGLSQQTGEGLMYDLPFNPVELADATNNFIPNAAMRQISCGAITVPKEPTKADMEIVNRKRERLRNYSRAAIVQALKKGNPVGFRASNHFVTIVGIEGDNLKILNSLGDKKNGYLETRSLSEMVENGAINLTWIDDVDPNALSALNQDIIYAENNLVALGAAEGVNRSGETYLIPVPGAEDANKLDLHDTVFVPKTISDPSKLMDKPKDTLNEIRAFNLENDKTNFKPAYYQGKAPVFNTVKKVPAVKNQEKAPAIKNEQKAPAIKKEQKAPAVKNQEKTPVFKQEKKAPVFKTETKKLKQETPAVFPRSAVKRVRYTAVLPDETPAVKDIDANVMADVTYDSIRRENVRQLRETVSQMKNIPPQNVGEINRQTKLIWASMAKTVADENIITICKAAGYTDPKDIRNYMQASEFDMISSYGKSEEFKNAVNVNLQTINGIADLDMDTAFEQMTSVTKNILDFMSTGNVKKESEKKTLDNAGQKARQDIEKIRKENLSQLRGIIDKVNQGDKLGDNALADPDGALKRTFAILAADEAIILSAKQNGIRDDSEILKKLNASNRDDALNNILHSKTFDDFYKEKLESIKSLNDKDLNAAFGSAAAISRELFNTVSAENKQKAKDSPSRASVLNTDLFTIELADISRQIKNAKINSNNMNALNKCVNNFIDTFAYQDNVPLTPESKKQYTKDFNETSGKLRAFQWDGKSPLSKTAQQEFKIMRRIENAIKFSTDFYDPEQKIYRSYTEKEIMKAKIAEKLLSCKAQEFMASKNPADIRKGISMLANNRIHDEQHKAILNDTAFKAMTSVKVKDLSTLLKTDNADFVKAYNKAHKAEASKTANKNILDAPGK